jgi:hypothetical protein
MMNIAKASSNDSGVSMIFCLDCILSSTQSQHEAQDV